MHNLNPWQIIIIGAGIVFGLPAIVGIITGHFLGVGGGIFSGLVVFVLIMVIVWRKLKGMARNQQRHDEESKDD